MDVVNPVAEVTTRASARTTWAPPVAVGAAGLAACMVLAARDPNVAGSYGVCPFLALTGHDCPGCGLMRGTHATVTGDFEGAVDHNVFVFLVLPLIAFAYLRWLGRGLGYDIRPLDVPKWIPVAAGVVVFGFWIIRNLGGPFEYLASTAS